jgi:hypothetical protein
MRATQETKKRAVCSKAASLGVIFCALVLMSSGCGGDGRKECEDNCKKDYDQCMVDAGTDVNATISCGFNRQVCVANCVPGM